MIVLEHSVLTPTSATDTCGGGEAGVFLVRLDEVAVGDDERAPVRAGAVGERSVQRQVVEEDRRSRLRGNRHGVGEFQTALRRVQPRAEAGHSFHLVVLYGGAVGAGQDLQAAVFRRRL